MEWIEYLLVALTILLIIATPLTALVLVIIALVRSRRMNRRIERLEAALSDRHGEPAPEEFLPEPVEMELVPAETVPEPAPEIPRKPIQWEVLIGQKALGWIAVVLLAFAAAFFLRYAYQNQWIGPLGRVAIGAAVGAALVLAGWHYHRLHWRVFSQMVTAGGLVVLYLATYSAFGFYHLLPQLAAGVFLAIIVVESVILAVRYESPAIALMAVIGGLLTPLLMQSERDQYIALFAYLSVLDLGVLLLMLARAWPAVGTLAMVGTQALFWNWYAGNYHPEKLAWTIWFQAVVYVLFLLHSLSRPLIRSRRSGWEDVVRLLLGAVFWFAAVYVLFQEDYGVWMGSAAMGMAVIYAAIARWTLGGESFNTRESLTALAISVGFVAMALPIQAEAAWIALGWMAVAAVLWWFALRVQAPTLNVIAAVLAVLAFGRVLFIDLPDLPREPFIPLLNEFALPALATVVCLLAGLLAGNRFVHRFGKSLRILIAAAGIGGIFLLWLVLSVDCYSYFDAIARVSPDRTAWLRAAQMSLSILWAVLATALLAVGFRLRLPRLRWLAISLYALTIGKVFFVDMAALSEIYRIMAFFVLAVFIGLAARAYQRLGMKALRDD